MKHAVATEHILDIIDDVRASLGGGLQGSQRAFYEELLASLPQFVAVGPQSAGKSSAVRRVCGISLPEASTLCTRIATLVQMRRSAEPSIRVTLVGPGGKELSAESNVDAKQVAAAVSKAQARRNLAFTLALALSYRTLTLTPTLALIRRGRWSRALKRPSSTITQSACTSAALRFQT